MYICIYIYNVLHKYRSSIINMYFNIYNKRVRFQVITVNEEYNYFYFGIISLMNKRINFFLTDKITFSN